MDSAMSRDLIASTEQPVIIGLGGTGLSCARYFQRHGVPCLVVDDRERPPGLADLRRDCPDVELITGEIPLSRLLTAGYLIVSPGVSLQHPAVAQAAVAGVPVMGDIDLFMQLVDAPVVGITGSNGKSTVTALLGAMLEQAGVKAGVGGNLGPAALELLRDEAGMYVLELSSFQLERSAPLGLKLACHLNVSPDHLDRHGDMQAYHAAKQRIFLSCQALVYNRDDLLTRPLQADSTPATSFGLGAPDLKHYGLRVQDGEHWLCRGFEPLMPAAEVALPGRHNQANVLACLALGEQLCLPLPGMLETLRHFSGLAHRSQPVATVDGVTYINDSKATNPAATRAALRGMSPAGGLLLIAGGQAKDADFSALAKDIRHLCKAVVLLGEDAGLLQQALDQALPVIRVAGMEEAVQHCAQLAQRGDMVLLSPACASFDQFSGFAERGEVFSDCVRRLREGARE